MQKSKDYSIINSFQNNKRRIFTGRHRQLCFEMHLLFKIMKRKRKKKKQAPPPPIIESVNHMSEKEDIERECAFETERESGMGRHLRKKGKKVNGSIACGN